MDVIMTHAFENAAKVIADAVLSDAVARLAEKYGFRAEEAMAFLTVTVVKEPIAVTQLPWCGKAIEDGCQAITFNQGLYTQCPMTREDDSPWCKKCVKQVVDDKPKFGTVEDRLACGMMDYKVGNKQVVPYANFMKRKNYTREYVEYSASHHGVTVHPDQFVLRKKIGRPGKPAKTMDAPEHEEELTTDPHATDESVLATDELTEEPPSERPSEPSERPSGSSEPSERPINRSIEPSDPSEPIDPREEGEVSSGEESEDEDELSAERIDAMNKEELIEACNSNDIEPMTGKKKWNKDQMKTALKEKLNL